MSRGVFGSPYFIVDGEPFWGCDRIPMLESVGEARRLVIQSPFQLLDQEVPHRFAQLRRHVAERPCASGMWLEAASPSPNT